jgi:bifunctional DNase/RNase
VLLFYLSGLTHAETAATLGIEVGAVKTRLHKARRTLRQELWTFWKEERMTVETQPIEVRIVDVMRDIESDTEHARYIVLLQEASGERGFPIWVGQTEGEAIALLLEGIETPRPLTYAFTASAVQALGGQLLETRIDRLAGEVFYASAHIAGSAGTVTVDARPSDTIALALALDAPIRVETELFATLAQSGKRSRANGEGAKEIVALVTERLQSRLSSDPARGERLE